MGRAAPSRDAGQRESSIWAYCAVVFYRHGVPPSATSVATTSAAVPPADCRTAGQRRLSPGMLGSEPARSAARAALQRAFLCSHARFSLHRHGTGVFAPMSTASRRRIWYRQTALKRCEWSRPHATSAQVGQAARAAGPGQLPSVGVVDCLGVKSAGLHGAARRGRRKARRRSPPDRRRGSWAQLRSRANRVGDPCRFVRLYGLLDGRAFERKLRCSGLRVWRQRMSSWFSSRGRHWAGRRCRSLRFVLGERLARRTGPCRMMLRGSRTVLATWQTRYAVVIARAGCGLQPITRSSQSYPIVDRLAGVVVGPSPQVARAISQRRSRGAEAVTRCVAVFWKLTIQRSPLRNSLSDRPPRGRRVWLSAGTARPVTGTPCRPRAATGLVEDGRCRTLRCGHSARRPDANLRGRRSWGRRSRGS